MILSHNFFSRIILNTLSALFWVSSDKGALTTLYAVGSKEVREKEEKFKGKNLGLKCGGTNTIGYTG